MRAISGLIKVKGEIEIDGKILGKDFTFPPSIGILIENPSFVAEYTGLKNLEMLACIKNKIEIEDIRHAMEQVGLILAIREPIKIFTWNEAEAWNSSGIYGKT